jgi:hypothetical protein
MLGGLSVNWIHLAPHGNQWSVLMNFVMNGTGLALSFFVNIICCVNIVLASGGSICGDKAAGA